MDRRLAGGSPRPPARRALDIAIVLVGLFLAWGAFVNALSNVAKEIAPETVLGIAHDDSGARSAQAARLSGRLDEPGVRARIADLVRGSLAYDIVNPRAIRVLGFVADADGQAARARRLNNLAQSLSRREAGAQLWLIEDAVRRGDVADALDHYDIALTTSGDSRPLLFPILAKALSDPAVRGPFSRLYSRNAEWVPSFLVYAMSEGHNPQAVADIVLSMAPRVASPDQSEFEARLMQALADQNDFARARSLAARKSGFGPVVLEAAHFAGGSINPSYGPFAWRLLSGADFGAQWNDAPGGARTLQVQAGPGIVQVAARKLIAPRPGGYHFAARLSVGVDGGAGANSEGAGFSLECLGSGGSTIIWRDPPRRDAVRDAKFNVLQSCVAAYLNVDVRGGDGRSGLDTTITTLSLTPIARTEQ